MRETWTQTVERYLREGRTVSGGKGDNTLKQSEQLSMQNQQAQMAFNQQLMGIFQKQYGDQKEVLDYLKNKMMPNIEHPQGYSDEALSGMRTAADDTISRNSTQAQQALQSSRFANGSRDLPSGVDDQLNAALLDSENQQKSAAQNEITQQNENLKQANYWNSVNALAGNAAMMNPQSYASSATNAADSASSAGNATASLGTAYNQSKKGFFSSFMNSLGSGLGSWLGGGAGINPLSGGH